MPQSVPTTLTLQQAAAPPVSVDRAYCTCGHLGHADNIKEFRQHYIRLRPIHCPHQAEGPAPMLAQPTGQPIAEQVGLTALRVRPTTSYSIKILGQGLASRHPAEQDLPLHASWT